jgi:arginase
MELAVATGRGPAGWADLVPPPIVRPEHAAVLGYGRERPEDAAEAELADPAIELIAAAELRGELAAHTRAVAARLASDPGRYWIHFDVDVLDETVLPAVTYPHLDGLGWDEAEAALRTLLEPLDAVVGLSVADYVPNRDVDDRSLELLTAMLERVLATEPPAAAAEEPQRQF